MREVKISRDGVSLQTRVDGVDNTIAPTIVFANAVGTTMQMWHKILPLLPDTLRFIRFDTRGHGRSDTPAAPYTMGALISDIEAVCDAHDVRNAVVVGLSAGGLVAQGLAIKRLDVVRGLVLSNTAAKIGNPDHWQRYIADVAAMGLEAKADQFMSLWFHPDFLATPDAAVWRAMLIATPLDGYLGVCAAIAGTDFYTPTSGLRLPTLGIACPDDRLTPPDLVRETVDLIPGSQFKLMRRCGHFPCIEDPITYAETLSDFLTSIGHI